MSDVLADPLMASLATSQGRLATQAQDGPPVLLCPACGGVETSVEQAVAYSDPGTDRERTVSLLLCGSTDDSHVHIDVDQLAFQVEHPAGCEYSIAVVVACRSCPQRSVLSMGQAHGATWTKVEQFAVPECEHEDQP